MTAAGIAVRQRAVAEGIKISAELAESLAGAALEANDGELFADETVVADLWDHAEQARRSIREALDRSLAFRAHEAGLVPVTLPREEIHRTEMWGGFLVTVIHTVPVRKPL